MSARDLLGRRGLAEIPRILTLQDRTPVSPTYGCFDRDYWHTRVMDFPSGMDQEMVLPLALAWSLDIPGNPYRGQEEIRRSVEAGIRFAARSAHKDGSCDDYYPFERAAGAAAFSLLACLDAAEIIGLTGDAEVDAFLQLRGEWLASHEESGRLSNHEGLISSCLARLSDRFGQERWEAPMRRRLGRLLSWQNEEGWFDEYGGADPGYLTLTIAQLADLDRRRPELGLREPCAAAVRFLATMIHPDGSLGGEYTSRSTQNYFPHGLELAGEWMPMALAINDLGLKPLAEGRGPAWDERLIGHYAGSWLLAWRNWRKERPEPLSLASGRITHPGARLLVDARADERLYLAWSRGGALRLYQGEQLLLADTGPTLSEEGGKVAVCHLEGDNQVEIGEDLIRIEGQMAYAKSARLTPLKSAVLRMGMITLGRFFPDLIRKLLQRMLVTGRRDAPYRFRRELEWNGNCWILRDEIMPDRGWGQVGKAGIGGFQTSLTTVMARVWQPAELQPWTDVTDRLEPLGPGDPLRIERVIDQRPQRAGA
jgi:hypothetical protein